MLGVTELVIDDETGKEYKDIVTEDEVIILPSLPLIPKREPNDFNTSPDDHMASNRRMSTIIPFTTPYKIKDPVIVLERCDNMSKVVNSTSGEKEKQPDKVVDICEETVNSVETSSKDMEMGSDKSKNLSQSQSKKSTKSYVEYQPALENGNKALPKFRFLVKDKQKLYSCLICGQQYTKHFVLKQHCQEVHNITCEKPQEKVGSSISDQNSSAEVTQSSSTIVSNNENRNRDSVDKSLTKDVQNKNSSITNSLKAVGAKSTIVPAESAIQSNQNELRKEQQQLSEQVNKQEQNVRSTNRKTSVTKCTLCKRDIKSFQKHLKDYHKINCADMLMKELNIGFSEPSTQKEENMHKMSLSNNDSEQTEKNLNDIATEHIDNTKEVIRSKRKRKLNLSWKPIKRRRFSHTDNKTSDSDAQPPTTYNCNICLGKYYTVSSYHRHTLSHFLRGETKQNFHMFKCVYKNSPLHAAQKSICPNANDNQIVQARDEKETLNSETPNKNVDNTKTVSRITRSKKNGKCELLSNTTVTEKVTSGETEKPIYSCECGRLFRTFYHSFVHKTQNKCSESVVSALDDVTKRNSSGGGISLTIKKKNNSYEVISTRNNDENKDKDSEHSKENYFSINPTDINSKNDKVIVTMEESEFYEYSKDHIILKLESVEEDIFINIEGDSDVESSSNHSNEHSEEQSILQNGQICERQENNITNNSNKEKRNTHKRKSKTVNGKCIDSTRTGNVSQNQKEYAKTSCTCGRKCSNLWILHKHIIRDHPLILRCAYCKSGLHSLKDYEEHECTATGQPFDMSLLYMPCDKCFVLSKNYVEYDEHNRNKHPASSVQYKCFICYKSYTTPELRLFHIIRNHNENDCGICGKTVRNYARPVHEAYHHGFGLPCHRCKKAFSTEHQFQRHIYNVHRGEKHDENSNVK